ncbi:hypothetical protein PINS_up023295 [Pythium insidiosum]|nr:hypothetical protein PINS_up023295 [Pythium insidiosum]
MDDFSVQVSALALSMRPEARMVAHQLRLKIYQDWRARLMERIFAGSALSSSPTTRLTPPGSPTCDDTVVEHRPGCEDALCVCALHSRLAAYKSVITSYIQASTKIKSKRATSSSPDAVSKQFCEPVDGLDLESDDGRRRAFVRVPRLPRRSTEGPVAQLDSCAAPPQPVVVCLSSCG